MIKKFIIVKIIIYSKTNGGHYKDTSCSVLCSFFSYSRSYDFGYFFWSRQKQGYLQRRCPLICLLSSNLFAPRKRLGVLLFTKRCLPRCWQTPRGSLRICRMLPFLKGSIFLSAPFLLWGLTTDLREKGLPSPHCPSFTNILGWWTSIGLPG